MTDDQPRFHQLGKDETTSHPFRTPPPSIENRISPTFSSDEAGATTQQTDGETKIEEEESNGGILWEITETLVLALLIFLAVRTVVLNFRVDGLSMDPTLNTGEMLLVNRQIYSHFDLNNVLNILPFVERDGEQDFYVFHPPQRGDIIVFDPPIGAIDKPYIKRVIALPGETVSIHDGAVFVNAERLDEPYLGSTATRWAGQADNFELVVPEEHIFVLGDNRNNSTDSRSFGPVEYDAIIGRAWIAYWPMDLFGIFQTPAYGQ
jgi:signal peptidase I